MATEAGVAAAAATSVLDASALIALLHDEVGADVAAEAIADGAAIGIVNVAEVLSRLADAGKDPAQARSELHDAAGDVDALAIEPSTEADCIEVALLRPRTRQLGLSLADRSCIALARRLRVAALTADRTWAEIDLDVEIRLIR